MDWTLLSLNTLVPQIPKIVNDNFTAFKTYMDVFYDESGEILIQPLTTTGKVKGGTGEFVNVVVDNLTVKNQYTNLYDNNTTADYNYYKMYTSVAAVPRDPCTFGIDTSVWTFPYEPSTYKVIDVNKPYYKINNNNPIFLANDNLSQVVGIFFTDASGLADYEIVLDPCVGTIYTVDASDSGRAYMEFVAIEYDASWGSTWAQYKYGADDSSTGGNGAVGPGTINYIPKFTNTQLVLDSSIYMDGDKLVTRDIQIHHAIRDSSDNILLGYGSPMQLSDPNSGRDVSIYGPVRIDGSLYVNDQEITSYNPSLSDSLEIPSTVGGLTSGTTVASIRGSSFESLWNDLLFPTVLAYVQTANSASLSGVSTATQEVGYTMSPETTGTYTTGEIYDGDGTTGPALTGDGNNYAFKLPNGTIDATYATAGNSQAHTFSSYDVIFGVNRWEVSIGYDAGSGAYYDNKGNVGTNLDAQRVAGDTYGYSSTITGRRYYWFGYGDASTAPENSAEVRALSDKNFLSASNTGSFTITIPAAEQEVYFFIPIGKTGIVTLRESSDADVTGSFTTGAISVDDAAGTPQSYESWVSFIGASGYPEEVHYDVVIS